jgi:transposase
MLTVTKIRLYPDDKQVEKLAKSLEAKRLIAVGMTGTANGGNVRSKAGRKSSVCSVAIEVRSPVL